MWDHGRSVLSWVMAHTTATSLAAIAAAFSALSSFLIMRVQWANLLESLRPELVLLYWVRETQGDTQTHNSRAVITFPGIKNVGRGAAFNVWLQVKGAQDGPYAMGMIRQPIIAPNEELLLPDGRIIVWFKDPALKRVRVPLTVSSWDSRGNEYETLYDLRVVRADIPFVGDTIAENVAATRKTTMTPAWRLRLRARRNNLLLKLGGVPILGKWLVRKP